MFEPADLSFCQFHCRGSGRQASCAVLCSCASMSLQMVLVWSGKSEGQHVLPFGADLQNFFCLFTCAATTCEPLSLV